MSLLPTQVFLSVLQTIFVFQLSDADSSTSTPMGAPAAHVHHVAAKTPPPPAYGNPTPSTSGAGNKRKRPTSGGSEDSLGSRNPKKSKDDDDDKKKRKGKGKPKRQDTDSGPRNEPLIYGDIVPQIVDIAPRGKMTENGDLYVPGRKPREDGFGLVDVHKELLFDGQLQHQYYETDTSDLGYRAPGKFERRQNDEHFSIKNLAGGETKFEHPEQHYTIVEPDSTRLKANLQGLTDECVQKSEYKTTVGPDEGKGFVQTMSGIHYHSRRTRGQQQTAYRIPEGIHRNAQPDAPPAASQKLP